MFYQHEKVWQPLAIVIDNQIFQIFPHFPIIKAKEKCFIYMKRSYDSQLL